MPLGDEAPAVAFGGAGIVCFVAAIDHLGEGTVMPGVILLIATGAFATLGFFLSPSIRNRWRWRSLSFVLSVFVGCVLLYVYYLQVKATVLVKGP